MIGGQHSPGAALPQPRQARPCSSVNGRLRWHVDKPFDCPPTRSTRGGADRLSSAGRVHTFLLPRVAQKGRLGRGSCVYVQYCTYIHHARPTLSLVGPWAETPPPPCATLPPPLPPNLWSRLTASSLPTRPYVPSPLGGRFSIRRLFHARVSASAGCGDRTGRELRRGCPAHACLSRRRALCYVAS